MRNKTSKNKSFPKRFPVWFAGLGPAPFAQLHLCCRDARRGQELYQAIGGLNRHGSITGNKNMKTKQAEKHETKKT